MSDAIVTRRLTKYYGRRAVVRDLNLRVPRGCVFGLLGRNGAGKSTALKMLVGMVQPDYGHVELLGEDLSELKLQTRARIAYLAEGHPIYTWMTIDQTIAFVRPFYPRWNDRLIEQVLDHFALARRTRIGRLSKGQRAQISLALALAPDPELLILDDPTLGLDTNVRRDFLESMIQLIQRQGRSILLSSHILADVERVADRVGVMIDGVLRADCPTEQFKQSVRKVVVEFSGPPPELPQIAGLIGDAQIGSRRELVFVGFGPEQQQALEQLEPRRLEVVELNLEDAFVEYTRGPRRPLALLQEEPRLMIRAIVLKELRENAWIAALALALYLALVYQLVPRERSVFSFIPTVSPLFRLTPESIPFVSGMFGPYFIMISYAAAIGLGFRQSTRESGQSTYLFLLHRPWSRDKIFLTKLAVGAALLLSCAAVPIVEYAWWAATPGDVAAPFEWSMTLANWEVWSTVPLVYLAAFLSGMRPARWYGTRLLPLVALVTMVLIFAMFEELTGPWMLVPGLLLLYLVYFWLIIHVARTRDYS